MNQTSLFSFPEQRVLADAAFARDVVPTRIFALLLPVWSVTIQAEITEAEDYELIDRFLARGIAEGGLATTAELAASTRWSRSSSTARCGRWPPSGTSSTRPAAGRSPTSACGRCATAGGTSAREVVTVLDAEVAAIRPDDELKRVRAWLRRQDLGEHRPRRLPGGLLRVPLPATCFGGDRGLAMSRVGSFVVQANGFFQLWCDDGAVRERALLSRVDSILAARFTGDRSVIADRVARIARQLELGRVGLTELRELALAGNRRGLAEQLNRLA